MMNNGGFKSRLRHHNSAFKSSIFQNCFHLRDWLEKDGFRSTKIPKTPKQYVSDTPCLAICADLANALTRLSV